MSKTVGNINSEPKNPARAGFQLHNTLKICIYIYDICLFYLYYAMHMCIYVCICLYRYIPINRWPLNTRVRGIVVLKKKKNKEKLVMSWMHNIQVDIDIQNVLTDYVMLSRRLPIYSRLLVCMLWGGSQLYADSWVPGSHHLDLVFQRSTL